MRKGAFFRILRSCALLALLPGAGVAKPILADLSQYRISIDAGFTGTQLLLFGARGDTGDVVVVVRGPLQSVTVRKKARVLGLWINRDLERFDHVPMYYTLSSSRRFELMRDTHLFAPLGIGMKEALMQGKPDSALPFAEALLRQGIEKRLYSFSAQPVSFMGESLFKLVVPFPDTIPHGDYSAEVYLFNDGQLASVQAIPILVESTGFDAWVYEAAHSHPVAYGALSVLIALGLGWVASSIMRRLS